MVFFDVYCMDMGHWERWSLFRFAISTNRYMCVCVCMCVAFTVHIFAWDIFFLFRRWWQLFTLLEINFEICLACNVNFNEYKWQIKWYKRKSCDGRCFIRLEICYAVCFRPMFFGAANAFTKMKRVHLPTTAFISLLWNWCDVQTEMGFFVFIHIYLCRFIKWFCATVQHSHNNYREVKEYRLTHYMTKKAQ